MRVQARRVVDKDGGASQSAGAGKRRGGYQRVIGVDPDSCKHGVAVYDSGKLASLHMLDLFGLVELVKEGECLVSIENVLANKFVYSRNDKGNRSVLAKISNDIGRNQQAQEEFCRLLAHLKVPYVLHRPQSGNWSERKALFEKVTGWTKRSNKDTRSAAYFGWLALQGMN
ncbi:hypothetical protein HBA55_29580 [Pseudomaricurvus alkylphenolicus]|uniref:hypothetical protein n=1 Tax=Pseudomaricurvus alkylphenolicus TaxID=1306991 RepID=UPI001422C34D|nr:hypothetical protein [Pseudomaricurvus alkylphenolicus]NIB43790.1 hypothetical protein [Pseudomaricurvus alkylphenolicus]